MTPELHPPTFVELPCLAGHRPVSVPRSAARAIRSLGFELNSFDRALKTLTARVRNQTLSPALLDFLGPVVAAFDGEITRGLSGQNGMQRVLVRDSSVRISWAALEANGAPPVLLALFHLPGLRTFWERSLRRTHYSRLSRELPRAWFVTTDPPPVGAVVPGLNITSWDAPLKGGPFVRFSSPMGDLVVEDSRDADALEIQAHYEWKDARIVLRAVE